MKTDKDPHGWGIAALVVLLALTLTASAHYIHTKIYCDPTHPDCVKISAAPETHAAAGAAHDAVPHEHPAEGASKATDSNHKTADTAHKAAEHGKSGS